MRAQARRNGSEEDEESAFVSMTDMTVGFLFIVMILLAFFASHFKSTDTVTKDVFEKLEQRFHDTSVERDLQSKLVTSRALRIRELQEEIARSRLRIDVLSVVLQDQSALATQRAVIISELKQKIADLEQRLADPLETYMTRVAEARRQILMSMRDALKVDFPDLQVQLSERSDALRFQGDGLFELNSSAFTPGKAEVVRRIAQRLNEVLPCYSFGAPPGADKGCNPDFAVVKAVQIEGHTDSTGPYKVNIGLSAQRAMTTIELMIDTVPALRSYKNFDDQTVMSFAGYGPDRPVVSNDTVAGRATNRRIDLRFIMLTPGSSAQVEGIRNRFIDLGVVRP